MITSRDIKDILNCDMDSYEFSQLGLADSVLSNTLTFIDDVKFIGKVKSNPNIQGLFITKDVLRKYTKELKTKIVICVEDPRYSFFYLLNVLGERDYVEIPSVISKKAKINSSASISETNVVIEDDVLIEANVTILPDTLIKKHAIIRAGAVIGQSGFEFKRTSKGILPVFHDSKVIINENVEVGSNSTLDKGLLGRDTVIGKNTKIDNLVHISHSVQMGSGCVIPAGAIVLGSVTIGDDVYIGPGAVISNGVVIADNATVSLGAVVVRNVKKNERVSGNFAIPHSKFITQFMRSLFSK